MQDKNEFRGDGAGPHAPDTKVSKDSASGGKSPASENGNSEKPAKTRRSIVNEIIAYAREFVLALIVSFLVTRFVFIIPLVPTGSMIPTINIDERIFVDKLSLWFSPVERGQVIVFPYPDDPSQLYVKRVIGMPGERVEIRGEKVYINDVPLDEPYLTVRTSGEYGPYYVPEGHIFVLGDNRNSSNDSRRWSTTNFVDLKEVQGRGVAILWPISQWRWIE